MNSHRLLGVLVAILAIAPAAVATQAIAPPPVASQAAAMNPINPSDTGTTIVLTGKDLTIDKVVAVARRGAKVEYGPSARQRSLDAYNLLLEGTRQNVPIYFFNRGAGSGRETVIFEGDALRPDNEQLLRDRQLASFRRGARSGVGPEVGEEEIVRAMMVVRANTMVYEAATPGLTQMLIDLINERVTPVVWSRGSPGEGDLPMMSNVAGTMVGVGDAYWKGERMTAAEALRRAGLDAMGGLRPAKAYRPDPNQLVRPQPGCRARRQTERLVGARHPLAKAVLRRARAVLRKRRLHSLERELRGPAYG